MKEDIKLEQSKEKEPKFCLAFLQADIWKWWSQFEDHEIKNNPGSSSFWDDIFCCLSSACFWTKPASCTMTCLQGISLRTMRNIMKWARAWCRWRPWSTCVWLRGELATAERLGRNCGRKLKRSRNQQIFQGEENLKKKKILRQKER